jgi:hypothetical protein
MSYPIRLAQLGTSGTPAGVMRQRLLRLRRLHTTAATICWAAVQAERVLELLVPGLALALERQELARLGPLVQRVPAVICCLRPYLAVLCLGLTLRNKGPIHKQMHKRKPTSYCINSICNNALI